MQKQRKKRIRIWIRRLNMMNSYKVYVRMGKIRKELLISQERKKRNTRRQKLNFTEDKSMSGLFVCTFFCLFGIEKGWRDFPPSTPFL